MLEFIKGLLYFIRNIYSENSGNVAYENQSMLLKMQCQPPFRVYFYDNTASFQYLTA